MKLFKVLARIFVGVVFVWYLFYEHEVGAGKVLARFEVLSWPVLTAALALYLAGQLLSAQRWGMLLALAGRPAPYGVLWRSYFTGMFFNLFLPTSIGGDVVRTVVLGRAVKSRYVAPASVFMDRNVGMAGLLAVGTVAAVLAGATIQATLFGKLLRVPLWPLFVVVLLVFAAANVVLFEKRWNKRTARLLRHLAFGSRLGAGKLAEKLVRLHDALTGYRLPGRRFLAVFVVSVIYQLSEISVVVLLARDLGITAPVTVFAALVPFAAVASLLPLTFSGMGVRELVFCAVLLGAKVPQGAALVLSLTYFGTMVAAGLCGGAVYLLGGLPHPTEKELARWAEPAGETNEADTTRGRTAEKRPGGKGRAEL